MNNERKVGYADLISYALSGGYSFGDNCPMLESEYE